VILARKLACRRDLHRFLRILLRNLILHRVIRLLRLSHGALATVLTSRVELMCDVIFFARAEITWNHDNVVDSRRRLEFVFDIATMVVALTSAITTLSRVSLPSHSRRSLIHVLLVRVVPALLLLLRLMLITLAALVCSGSTRAHLVSHLLNHMRSSTRALTQHVVGADTLLEGASLLPVRVMIVEERRRSDTLHMNAHSLRFVEDSLQAVDKILMVIIAFVDIKHGKNELVFVMDKLLKQLDIIGVAEMITS